MRDDAVGAGLGHRLGLLLTADIDDREEIHLAGDGHHLELLLHAHPRLFEDLAEAAVDNAVGGEVVDPTEAHVLHL